MLRLLFLLTLVFLQSCTQLAPQEEPAFRVAQLTEEDVKTYKLDTNFYKKGLLVHDILIATSNEVNDLTLLETAYLFDKLMLSVREDIRQRISDAKVLCILVGKDELTSDIPQYKTKLTGEKLDFYNWRRRGFVDRRKGQWIVLFAEEDVLEYKGGNYRESILIHEFGHVVHRVGFDKALNDRLAQVYKTAKEKNLWMDGATNHYFRGIQSETPVSVLDALHNHFTYIPKELLVKCLDSGDILVNGKKANAKVKAKKKEEIKIVFGGPKRCYAMRNIFEYFGEGYQTWYDTNRVNDHDHNHIHTRDQLCEYDVELGKFCREFLSDDEWKFVSPKKRVGKAHLRNFDPSKSPEKKTAKHLIEAGRKHFDEYWKPFWHRLARKHGMKLDYPEVKERRG